MYHHDHCYCCNSMFYVASTTNEIFLIMACLSLLLKGKNSQINGHFMRSSYIAIYHLGMLENNFWRQRTRLSSCS